MEKIIELINDTYNTYHSKSKKMTVADRLKGIGNAYLELIELCKENYLDEAKKYYKTRQKK